MNNNIINKKINKYILAALFLTLALILPFLSGQLREVGKVLLLIHYPIYLCGFILGPFYGLIIGLIAPILRSFVFGMPVLFPNAIAMAFELATYGFTCGYFYNKLNKNNFNKYLCIYISLILAMIIGRIIWIIIDYILLGITNSNLTLSYFIFTSFVEGLPGIIIQLIVIPILVILFNKNYL